MLPRETTRCQIIIQDRKFGCWDLLKGSFITLALTWILVSPKTMAEAIYPGPLSAVLTKQTSALEPGRKN
jgi:hypothetical protein